MSLPITLDQEYKTCNKCKISQPIRVFDKNKKCLGGRDHRCRTCKNEQTRANYHYKKQLKLKQKEKKHD